MYTRSSQSICYLHHHRAECTTRDSDLSSFSICATGGHNTTGSTYGTSQQGELGKPWATEHKYTMAISLPSCPPILSTAKRRRGKPQRNPFSSSLLMRQEAISTASIVSCDGDTIFLRSRADVLKPIVPVLWPCLEHAPDEIVRSLAYSGSTFQQQL